MNKEKFDTAKYKASLVASSFYKEIRDLQIKKCLELSKSNIEPLELKGMMKLIATTDDWEKEFENILKDRKEQQEGN